jgi:hypothetical protein
MITAAHSAALKGALMHGPATTPKRKTSITAALVTKFIGASVAISGVWYVALAIGASRITH